MESFSKRGALSSAFNILKNHFWRIFGFVLLMNIISFSLQTINEKVEMPILFQTIFAIMTSAVGVIINMGFIKFCLDYVDNRQDGFADIYSSYPLFWKYLGTSILYGLIVTGGLFLLIIPGFIWAYKFYFSQYLVIDKGLSPIAALKESSRITNGHKWNLFIFSIIFVGLLFVPTIPFIVMAIAAYYTMINPFIGMSVSIIIAIVLYVLFIIIFTAFSMLAYTYVYRRLSMMNMPLSVPPIDTESPLNQPENPPTL